MQNLELYSNLFDNSFFLEEPQPLLIKMPSSNFICKADSPKFSNLDTNTKEDSQSDFFSSYDQFASEENSENNHLSETRPYIKATFNEMTYEEVVPTVHSNNTNLNTFVEDVLTAGPIDPTIKRKRVARKKISKRVRKTKEQVSELKKLYEKTQDWEKEDVLELASRTMLSSAQVYKWYWDQQKKEGKARGKRWE